MSVPSGIHVIYSAYRAESHQHNDNPFAYLYRLQFDGATNVATNEWVAMSYGNWIGAGASAIRDPTPSGVQINIQCTMSGSNNVHFVTYKSGSSGSIYTDYGEINTPPWYMKSSARTAAMLVPGIFEQIWYSELDSSSLYYQNSGQAGTQFSDAPVSVGRGSGPGAVYFAGASYVAVHQEGQDLAVFRIDANGNATDISPPSGAAPIAYSPTLVGLEASQQIMLLYSSADDNVWGHGQRGLYFNIYDLAAGTWSPWQFASCFPDKPDVSQPALMTDSPGACVFGDRVYCFFQDQNGALAMQVYMGDRWMIDAVEVMDSRGAVKNVWYGPCAVAI